MNVKCSAFPFFALLVLAALLLPGFAHAAALNLSPNFINAGSIDDTNTATPFSSLSITHTDDTMPLTGVISFPKVRGSLSPTNGWTITNDATSVYYVITNIVATNAQSKVRALVYDPVENRISVGSSETTTFNIVFTDTNSVSDSASADLQVNAVNDAPHLSGLATIPTALNDNVSTQLFSGVTVTDVDNLGAQPVTLTLTWGESAPGFFVYQGNQVTTVTLTGTPTNVMNTLHTLPFNTYSNRFQAGQTYVKGLQVLLQDEASANAPENSTNNVTFTSINDPPSATMTLVPGTFNDNVDVQPFRIVLQDYDLNDALSVVIQPVNDPTYYFGSVNTNGPFTGPNPVIQSAIQAVHYTPVPNRVTNSQVVKLRFLVTDYLGLSGSVTGSVTVLAVNDPPVITGVSVNPLYITDDPNQAPLHPFPNVNIGDPDAGETNVVVALSVSDPSRGTLSQTNFSGSAAAVTAAVRGTTFSPLRPANRQLNTTVSVKLNIAARDSANLTATNNTTTINITAVNASPVVFVPTNQPVLIPPAPLVGPFTNCFVQDDDVDYTYTTNGNTITTNSAPSNKLKAYVWLDNPLKGVLTNLGGFAYNNGIYSMTNTAAEITRALTNMLFDVNDDYVFPPNEPGGTRFSIRAVDTDLHTTIRDLQILLQNLPVNRLVTRVDDDGLPGSLRWAVTNSGNNDVITFALANYPETIRLDPNFGPMELKRNLTFKGPGADLLTISGDTDGDGDADTQIFRVFASVNMDGLTLTRGKGAPATDGPQTGGAIFVGSTGRLTLRNCAITYSRADQWGGAIDVAGGSLAMDHCLLLGNETDSSVGLGGGAISLYTVQSCSFANTTFSQNRQRATGGFGGGAIYAENPDSYVTFNLSVVHCTFAGNQDASALGTAIGANAFGTEVHVRNSIFNNTASAGQNLEEQGAALIVSDGGNISRDSSRTILTQGGVPRDITILDKASDRINTDPKLAAFSNTKPTGSYPLQPSSPAIGLGVGDFVPTDQNDAARDSTPDSGAVEFNADRQLVLNEIHFVPSTSGVQFLEFYLRRTATSALDLGGYTLWIDGVPRHEFTAGNSTNVIQPGRGIIVADSIIPAGDPGNGNPTVVVVPRVGTNTGTLQLGERGLIELRRPDPSLPSESRVVFSRAYVGVFEPAIIPSTSLTLAPQFVGFALLPHWKVVGGTTNSPGRFADGTPFGGDNAPPIAAADTLLVGEDDLRSIAVLENDTDADGGDVRYIIDVSRAASQGGNDAATNSLFGARVLVNPTNSPLRGTNIVYDPRHATTLQSLPEGATLVDEFYYSILDYGHGAPVSYSSASGGTQVLVQSPAHRLTNGEPIRLFGVGTAGYNGTFNVISNDLDSFRIVTNFVDNPAAKGEWLTVNTRHPTQRSEAKVSLTILGANDPPTPAEDHAATYEDVVIRIMGDAILAGTTNTTFDTDVQYSPPPVVSPVSLLNNDSDPDTDDNKNTLKVVGVAGQVFAVADYQPTETNEVDLVALVKVMAPNHGLEDGQKVLISGYGGHPSYNALHSITVTDSNSFTLPTPFVDDDPTKGSWAVLDDATRLTAKSLQGADVKLEIRTDRIETSIIYNPRVSDALNHLGLAEHTNDTFYYVAQDSHGALAFARVVVDVTGVDDLPVPRNDPSSLSQLDPLVGGTNTLGNVVDGLEAHYYLPPASGNTNQVDVQVDSGGQGFFLADMWVTLEDRALAIPASALLGNDSDVDYVDTLTISAVSSLSHDQAAVSLINGGATVLYDPAASSILNKLAREELEVDAFEITVNDGAGGLVTNLVAVLVIGVNDPPVARDDHSGTPEDVKISFDPRYFPPGTNNSAQWDFDVDINGHPPDNQLTLIPVDNFTTPGGARVDVRTNTFFYDPSVSKFLDGLAWNQTFNDTFTYTVTDGSFLFAQDDLFQVLADGDGYVLNVLVNDVNYNPQGGSFQIVSVDAPNHGGTNFNTGTNVIYAPQVNFVGDEVFTYTVMDEAGNEDTGLVTVRVTVNQRNGQLQANADDFSAAKGESVELDVLSNDNIVPTPGSVLTIESVTPPSAGGAASISGGKIAYTPDPLTLSGMYVETFSYTVSGGGTARATALVTVTVTNRTDTLAIQDDAFAVLSASRSNLLDVLFNDGILPAGGGGLTIYSINTNGLHGLAQIAADGLSINYTPNSNFVGLETNLTYVAVDELGGSGSGRVSIAVGGLAICPDAFVVNTTNTTLLEVLSNDRQLQGPVVSLTLVSVSPGSTALGTVSVLGNQLQFVPNGTVGETNLTYVVADGAGGTATGQVAIETASAAAGEQLFASPDTYSVLRGSVGNALDVLANDVAVPDFHRPMTIVSTGTGLDAPNHGGVVTISADNRSLLYTPAPGFSGEETFTYTMTDSRQTDTAKVIIKVSAGSLVAGDDEFTVYFETNANGPLQFTLPVMANDKVQPNFGQVLTITGVGINDTNAANAPSLAGLVAINGDATALLYTPQDTHPPYVERFTYEITDGTARRAQGVVLVRVQLRTNVRDIETHDDRYTVAANSSSNFLAVLVNDGVKPASASLWSIIGLPVQPLHGVAQAVAGGIVYWPNANFVGTDHFRYAVADGVGGTGAGDVTVKVGQVDVSADSFAVLSGTTNNLLPAVANDFLSPVSFKTFLIGAVGTPDHGGSAVATGDRLGILYGPNPSYAGPYPYQERFSYDVLDDTGGTTRGWVTVDVFQKDSDRDTGLITITVQGVNDAPTIANTAPPPLITDKQTGLPFANVTIGDVDNQGQEILVVTIIIDDAAKGVLTNSGGFVEGPAGTYVIQGTPTNVTTATRALVFVPTENRMLVPQIENTLFTILADDSHVTTSLVVTQAVQAVNDPPIISGTRSNQTVYEYFTIKPFSSVTITEVDYFTLQPLSVTVTIDNPTHGFLSSLGAFVDLGGGVYQLGTTNAGVTAATASAALRSLVFNPTTGGRVTPTSPESTRFTITVNDNFAPPVSDNLTTVLAIHEFQTKKVASDGAAGDHLGTAVAASRDFVVAGAPLADLHGNNSGAAYIYQHVSLVTTQWTQFQKLAPADTAAGDEFGNAVAISGNTVVVGAHFHKPAAQSSGAVYVYERTGSGTNQWAFLKKLSPFDGVNGDDFGVSVSLDKDTLVVGARADDDAGTSSGSAYVYYRNQGGSNNWGFVKKLTAGDAAGGDEFGMSVGVQADTVIVGAHLDVQAGLGTGSAYVFARHQGGTNNWGQVKKLVPPDGVGTDDFGFSVSVYGDTVAVGADRHDLPVNDAGAAYLFERDLGGAGNWGFLKKLLSPTILNNDQFGYSVSLDRDKLVVGEPFQGIDNQSKYGAAYAYARNVGGADNWGLLQNLTRADFVNNDQYGVAVALGQDTVAVGASMTDGLVNDIGSVYIFRLKYDNAPALLNPLTNYLVAPNVPFSFALPPNAFGDPDVGDPLVLSTSPLPLWTSFDPLTGTFSGLPTSGDLGTYPINVTATDEDLQTAIGSFSLIVGFDMTYTPGDQLTIQRAPGGKVIEYHGIPGHTYILQRSTDFLNWTPIHTNTPATGTFQYLETGGPPTAAYYRVFKP